MSSLIDKIEGTVTEKPATTIGSDTPEGSPKLQTRLLAYMAFLATGYTLYFAREIFIPIFLALALKLLLAPAMRLMTRFHLPQSLSALILVVTLVGGVGGIGYAIEAPAAQWIQRIPREAPKLAVRLKDLLSPFHQVQQATRQVEAVAQAQNAPATTTVVMKEPSMSDYLFSGTRSLLTSIATVLLLLLALLATGDHFLRRIVENLPRFSDKKQAVEVARQVERDISTYLATITAINVIMGCVAGTICWIVGLPNPLLWGVVAGTLNYIPYLGPLSTMLILSFVGMMTFQNLSDALFAPMIYAGATLVEGNVLTPLLLSHRLEINAVCVFVGLMVFAAMWGIPGMLLAVPLLAMLRVICDHITPLVPIGKLLGNGKSAI